MLCRTVNERRSWDNCAFIETEQKVYKLNTILPEWVRPANPFEEPVKKHANDDVVQSTQKNDCFTKDNF